MWYKVRLVLGNIARQQTNEDIPPPPGIKLSRLEFSTTLFDILVREEET